MQALRDLANRAKNISKIENKLFKAVVLENKKAILDLNREQMYEHGIVDVNKPNESLPYTNFTIDAKEGYIRGIKPAKFPRTDHITLKWSGAVHESLELNVGHGFFLIWSANPTWQFKLQNEERFKNALGLTEDSINKIIELFVPLFQEYLRKYLTTGNI